MAENVLRLFPEAEKAPSRFDELWRLPRSFAGGRWCKGATGLEYIEALSMPEPNTGCWIWLGATDRKGYGRMKRIDGTVAAHRYALTLRVGPIGDLHALHRCDNPSCVNPDHLFPGTPRDNTDDMMRKGRHRPTTAKGEDLPMAKLTEAAAREIKRTFKRRDPQYGGAALARKFGVSICTVSDIVHNRTWRHV